jgi:hypothetical protein
MSKGVEEAGRRALSRTEGLVVTRAGEELLVYDLDRHRAHCLNRAAEIVWGECNGVRTIEEIAERVGKEMHETVNGEWVTFALKQLEEADLLAARRGFGENLKGISRREMVRRLRFLGAVAAVPLVASILAPTAQAAGSCKGPGAACTASVQCCTGVCNVTVCV